MKLKKNVKKILGITFLLFEFVLLLGVFFEEHKVIKTKDVIVNSTDGYNYGIKIKNDGTMAINNSYFKAMGLNGFAFIMNEFNVKYGVRLSDNPKNYKIDDYKLYFETLKKYKIPFVRITFGGYHETAYNIFDKSSNHHEYFEIADKIVKEAEKNNVGIIMNFFWNMESVTKHVGESLYEIANKDSKTIKYQKDFINAIISRYKESPAIWGYEISNELNLNVDLARAASYQNQITSDELDVYFNTISDVIKRADGTRLITTGDSMSRFSSYSLYKVTRGINYSNHRNWAEAAYGWDYQGVDNYKYMVKKLNNSSVNSISLHLYKDGSTWDMRTMSDVISVYTNVANELKKPLYVGEFNTSYEDSSMSITQKFAAEVDAIKNSSVQLSSPWLADGAGRFLEYYSSDNDTFLKKIQSYNSSYQNVIDNAWNTWKKSIAVNANNNKYTITRSNAYNVESVTNKTSSYYLPGDKIKIDIQSNDKSATLNIKVTSNNKAIEVKNNEFVMPNGNVVINIEMANNNLDGDVNGDGKVSSSDYIMVRKHILGQSLLSGKKLLSADMNNDGKISASDYISIKKIILYG